MQNSPVWSNWIRTPELSIALMDEWEDKIEQLAQSTMHENVTSISGVPTWTLVLIKRILEISGKQTLAEVWPNLELYMHGGVSFVPYKEQFKKLIGKDINYLETIMPVKDFLLRRKVLQKKACCYLHSMASFTSLCPSKNMEKNFRKPLGLTK